MEQKKTNKRYIVLGDNGSYTAIQWNENEPFELHTHQINGRRYKVVYAKSCKDAKLLQAISDLEDLVDALNNGGVK